MALEATIKGLAEAIGYPEKVPEGVLSFLLRVDGLEVLAEVSDARLVLSTVLTADETMLPTLASYAAGRMQREEAILSWGDSGAFLWQDAPAGADSREMMVLFETFMNSCDWWRARLDALRGGESAVSEPETLMIRP